jgi:hypothetical protein
MAGTASAGAAGAVGRGSGGTAGASTADAGQPLGSLCANDGNCSQSAGRAVCCKAPECAGPCECALASTCPGGNLFLPCNQTADCAQYGGGKICCEVRAGNQTQRYCTKQNGCTGTRLP